MATTPIRAGDYLFLRPEDVKQKIDSVCYAVVISVTRSSVRVESVTDSVPGSFSIPKSSASAWVVSAEEARGDQPGLWLRKAVCVKSGRFYYHGQVVRQEEGSLYVATHLGERPCSADQIATEVYPVIAMAMGSQRWSEPIHDLESLHNKLLDSILEGRDGRPLSSTELVAIVPSLKLGAEHCVEWQDPVKGTSLTTSLDHVLRYVFYVDGKRDIPDDMRNKIGDTFCADSGPRVPRG
ncbi:hypothetical protein DVH05_000399 [Phytophthora capsici]|nr:hypothetical protein DVH05_000399 [Phytophthora capsici]